MPEPEAGIPAREPPQPAGRQPTAAAGRLNALPLLCRAVLCAAQVVVSLKRLEDDPLKETLDNVLPLNDPEVGRALPGGASQGRPDAAGCARTARKAAWRSQQGRAGSRGLGGRSATTRCTCPSLPHLAPQSSYAAVDAVPAAVPQGVDEILEALSREPAVQAVSLGRCVEEKRTVSQARCGAGAAVCMVAQGWRQGCAGLQAAQLLRRRVRARQLAPLLPAMPRRAGPPSPTSQPHRSLPPCLPPPPPPPPRQDLELWITKDKLDDGFNLAVRAGRLVQEVHVATRMSADEMRATVQRVLRSIN